MYIKGRIGNKWILFKKKKTQKWRSSEIHKQEQIILEDILQSSSSLGSTAKTFLKRFSG